MLSLLLICIGIFFRLCLYIYDHSLWLDEAWLARDVVDRSVKETLLNVFPDTSLPALPPVGFLLIEKFFVAFFGNTELSLRLFPFLCGAASVFLYWLLLKKWADRLTALMALGLFAVSGPLIHYCAQCKQYSTEVFVAIFLYLSAWHFFARPARPGRVWLFALTGMAAMAVSHTAIFVLAAVAIAGASKRGYFYAYAAWAVFFIWIYFAYLRVMLSSSFSMGAFCLQALSPHFMPSLNPFSWDVLRWLGQSVLDFFAGPAGLKPAALALGMAVLGAAGVLRSDKRTFIMLVGPAVLMLIACALKKFPFHDRFVLFMVPAALFLAARGVGMIMARGKIGMALGLGIFLVLCVPSVKNAVEQCLRPQGHEETRLLMGFLKHNQLAGDEIFMNNSAQQAYAYYLTYYRFHSMPAKKGYFLDAYDGNSISLVLRAETAEGLDFSLTRVYRRPSPLAAGASRTKQRTWLFLTHLITPQTEQFITGCFDDRGKQLLQLKQPGASLYLYELYEPLKFVLK